MDFNNERITRWVFEGYFFSALVLAGAQIIALSSSVPGPDAISYFEVADQIQQVGYAKALPEHWSPLYPLYIFFIKRIWPTSLENEVFVSMVSNAGLMLLAWSVAFFFLRSLAKLFWQERKNPIPSAWITYGSGLALYFFFVIHRVNLRLPDTLVFCFTALALWAWREGLWRSLSLKWVFWAGVFSGVGFLARSNILHWSLATGIIACCLAPKGLGWRRVFALLLFLIGISIFFVPQLYVMSKEKGSLTFGESGKVVFAETYGASWKNGKSAWPLILAEGDVRVFVEERWVNFPGFYAPEKEYEGATIPFRFFAAVRGIVRSIQSTLFGYWSPRFGLLWPILWAIWPFFLFGFFSWPFGKKEKRKEVIPNSPVGRQRIGWFLVAVGFVGVGMHLLSFSIGYYLPPYLFSLLVGLCLLLLCKWEKKGPDPLILRSLFLVSLGFALVATLSTLSLFREAHIKMLKEDASRMENLVAALKRIPPPQEGLRRIAVGGGGWLGLYAIRVSRSQVYADIPDLEVFKDPPRLDRAIQALRQDNVQAVLAPVAAALNFSRLNWVRVENTGWCLLHLGEMKKMNEAKPR